MHFRSDHAKLSHMQFKPCLGLGFCRIHVTVPKASSGMERALASLAVPMAQLAQLHQIPMAATEALGQKLAVHCRTHQQLLGALVQVATVQHLLHLTHQLQALHCCLLVCVVWCYTEYALTVYSRIDTEHHDYWNLHYTNFAVLAPCADFAACIQGPHLQLRHQQDEDSHVLCLKRALPVWHHAPQCTKHTLCPTRALATIIQLHRCN